MFTNRLSSRSLFRQLRSSQIRLAFLLSIGLSIGITVGGAFNCGVAQAQETPRNAQKQTAPASLGPNLLPNGDFARESAAWTSELMNGKANATLAWPADASLPAGVTGKVARFEVEAIDKERWHVQFYQNGLNLNNNETYTVTFWARSGENRLLSISANEDEGDYHALGLDNRLAISPQWRKYSLAFTALHARKNHARLCFILGDALGRVELADVRLQQGAADAPLGSNLLRNAGFEQGMASWLPLIVEAPAQATLQLTDAPPANVGGKVAHLAVSQPGTQLWHAYFGQSGLKLEEGQTYTLSFWAKSGQSRSLTVYSDIAQDDYHQTGLHQMVELTPNWNRFTFVFTPTNTGNSVARIIFAAGDAVGDVDVAGVTLQHGATPAVKKPAPSPDTAAVRAILNGKSTADKTPGRGDTRAHRSHPLLGTWQSFHKEEGLTGKEYQRYRFVFEANGNGSLQVATMSADPADPPRSQQTEAFKWDLIEGGPHISIGANVYTWTIDKDGAKQKLTLKNYEGKTYILFRQ